MNTVARRLYPDGRRRRAAAAVGLAVLGLGVLAATAGTPTDAGFRTRESASLSVAAGTVESPAARCRIVDAAMGVGGAHQLEITPPAGGLPVTGYLVDITAVDHGGSTARPAHWKTSDGSGEPYLAYGQNLLDAAPDGSPVRIRWGIAQGLNWGWDGTVTVRAVGPGGWQSEPITQTWAIWFTVVGTGHGSC